MNGIGASGFAGVCLSLVVMFAFGSVAHAGDAATAEALFVEGQTLFQEGRVDEACDKFDASLAAEWGLGTLINLARCHAAQGRTATAWAEYREAADKANKAGETDRAEGASAAAAELEPKLCRLVVLPPADPPDGLAITRGNTMVKPGLLGSAVPIDPGKHQVSARAPGYEEWKTEVDVSPPCAEVRVSIPALEPIQVQPESSPSSGPQPDPTSEEAGLGPVRVAGIAVGIVGVAALVVGGVLGAMTLSDVSEADEDDNLCGGDMLCTPEGHEMIDSARTKGIASTVLLAVGGAAVVSGVLMLALGGESGSADIGATLVPSFGMRSGGLTVMGRF